MTPGTVTGASPLLVHLDGSTSAKPSLHLASYAPAVGDRVVVVEFDGQILTLGKYL